MHPVIRLVMFVALFGAVCRASNACTIFMASDGQTVLAGNNEDWSDPSCFMWLRPATENKNGRVVFGFRNGYAQGGMNEHGLFFDGAWTEHHELAPDAARPAPPTSLLDDMLASCATVDEAIAYLDGFDVPWFADGIVFLADRSGASAIYEGDAVVRGDGKWQVCTNFRQSARTAEQAGCDRAPKIASLVGDPIDQGEHATVQLIREALIATHAEGEYATKYSCVYDLTKGDVHLYADHNYEVEVRFNLAEQLAKGEREILIPTMFEDGVSKDLAKDPIPHWNTRCPLSGTRIDATAAFDHADKRLYFCCIECARRAYEEPDRWIEKVYGSEQDAPPSGKR